MITRCGHGNVERIVISKPKASEPLTRENKQSNTSTDFVYCQPAAANKIKTISPT
jgi:hypothetical protein